MLHLGAQRGGQVSTIPRAPNHCRGAGTTAESAEKSQQYRKYFFQYSTFATKRHQIPKWGGRQIWFLPRATSNRVTPLAAGIEFLETCFL